VRQCLSIRQVRSSGRGQSEASCDRRPAPTNRCAKAPDRTRRVLLWKTHSGGRHTIRHWGVCLAGLLSGFGQDCIDCAQRISGALRDFRAPVPACLFSKSTFWMVSSGSGGLPSILPLPRATLSPAMVRSDILARSCFASVANIATITSLNGPVESNHCSWLAFCSNDLAAQRIRFHSLLWRF
jgi:hypothetical protein